MSNTQLRIISALAMVLILLAFNLAGPLYCIGLLGVVGVLVIDEVVTNFLKIQRSNKNYLINQLCFIVPFVWLNFIDKNPDYYKHFFNAGFVLDGIMLLYLFTFTQKDKKKYRFTKAYKFLVGGLILIPFVCLSYIFTLNQWSVVLWALLVLNFSMDTGAWVWGKNFGKHKLWPAVSPNKTIEGLVGGILTSAIVTSVYWYGFFKEANLALFLCFSILALCSQLGDLVQSKVKRQFRIKDSSQLIPGHGGVYDRVDSLLFVAPLFMLVLTQFYPFAK